MRLNEPDGPSGSGDLAFNETAPTSTEFTVGSLTWGGTNEDGSDYVAYLFADTPGKIKCGGYQGNGTSGHFIDCGFKPGWVLIKVDSNGGDWRIHDNKRLDPSQNNTPYNLRPNKNAAESPGGQVQLNDNGFSLLATSNEWNSETETYIYVAIAEDVEVGGFNPTGEVVSSSATDNTLTLSNVSGTWGVGNTATGELAFPGNLDDSGNSNNFTGTGFVEADIVVDSPEPHGEDTGAGGEFTSNYSTLNTLTASPFTINNGALDAVSNSNYGFALGTIGVYSVSYTHLTLTTILLV